MVYTKACPSLELQTRSRLRPVSLSLSMGRMFATAIHFYPRLIFAGEARNLLLEGSSVSCSGRLLVLPTNIRLGWKWMEVTNTILLRYGNNYCRKKFYSTGLWTKLKKYKFLGLLAEAEMVEQLTVDCKFEGLNQTTADIRGQCYKTFHGCKLWIFLIS